MRITSSIIVLFTILILCSQGLCHTIDNAVVYLEIDHNQGDITVLRLKAGSNQDIVDQTWSGSNNGLCQLPDETCSLLYQREGNLGARFIYDTNYGRKTITLDWTDDFEATLEWDLNAPVSMWYNAWKPGGSNNTPNDRFAVEDNGRVRKGNYTYPGPWTLLFEGVTPFTAITDLDHQEVFGYRFYQPLRIRHANGVSVDHYIHDIPAGYFRARFGLKRTSGSDWWNPIRYLDMSDNWTTFQHDFQRTGSTIEEQIPPLTRLREYATTGQSPKGYFHLPLIVDGAAYFCVDRTLYSIDIDSWTLRWTFNDPSRDLRMVAYHDGALFVSARVPYDGVIYKLDASSGSVLWQYSVPAEVEPVAVGNGMVYIGYGTYWGGPYGIKAIDENTGTTEIWNHSDPSYNFGPPTLSEDNSKVVAARQDKVYCFDALNGQVLWTYDAGALWGVRTPIVVADVVFAYYAGSSGNWAFALDLGSGQELWRTPLPAHNDHGQAGAVYNDKFYLGLGDTLFALDCGNGSIVWDDSLGTGTRNNAPIVTNNGVIYFTSGERLYAYAADSGQYLWDDHLGADATHCIPTVSAGKLYVLNNIGELREYRGAFSLRISPDPLIGGSPGTFSVIHGSPNTNTYLAYSLAGSGSTYVPLLDVTLGLTKPKKGAGPTLTDHMGLISWTLSIPAVQGVNVWLQAAQFGRATNVVDTRIQ